MGLRMLNASRSLDGGALHSACRAETCLRPGTECKDFNRTITATPRKPVAPKSAEAELKPACARFVGQRFGLVLC